MIFCGCTQNQLKARNELFDKATAELGAARTEEQRFYALNAAAKESFNAGDYDAARQHAHELMRLSAKFQDNWNFGNAVHDANLVLGRIALREGRVEAAKRYLLDAAGTRGSPQLNIFGPNLSLANDLLTYGEDEAVTEYLRRCAAFWVSGRNRLTRWRHDIVNGRVPDFGPNLYY